jgi:catechol 2,3-dioxygenase-like lactoylglutathione lyase family enzyme
MSGCAWPGLALKHTLDTTVRFADENPTQIMGSGFRPCTMQSMFYEAIDSVYGAILGLDACRPYGHLGLRLSAPQNGSRTLQVGGLTNLFAVHFLTGTSSSALLAGPLRQGLAGGRALFAVALRVADLLGAVRHLASQGIPAVSLRDGDEDLAWLPLHDQAGTDIVLVQDATPVQERHAAALQHGLLGHAFPLRRLDHLAVVTHDLEARTRFWTNVLSVPVVGEVKTPVLIIRQLRLGDAVLELLGPAGSDSPLWQRPPGLVSMASWEVPDLDQAVAQARAAGFTVSDPAVGVLPGTRTATIPGAELAGVNMQLLEYA